MERLGLGHYLHAELHGRRDMEAHIRDGAPEEGRDAIDAAFREQIEQADSTSFAYHPLATSPTNI
ncbi:hypothetical protein GS436_16915 [Rhodococcus hoagii]|nr:hypothetical protein [Prescottella equi]